MSKKGSITTADYLPYEDYKRLVQSLIDEKKYWWACYCILSFCTGLRISDVLRLKWSDVLDQRKIVIVAKKTGKTHGIPIGENAMDHFRKLYERMGEPDMESIILARHGSNEAVSCQYINREIKKWASRYNLDIENFSSHSFRKTFGRYVYEKSGCSDKALMYLNRIFKHSNIETTMIYLGIRDEEISGIFKSIEI